MVTWTCAAALGSFGGSPEPASGPAFFFFFFEGSVMLLSMPKSTFFLSPTAINASRSGLYVGENMQKTADCLAALTAATTVSSDTRLAEGSGEKKTRTLALPILTGADHPVSLAVAATAGSGAISSRRVA